MRLFISLLPVRLHICKVFRSSCAWAARAARNVETQRRRPQADAVARRGGDMRVCTTCAGRRCGGDPAGDGGSPDGVGSRRGGAGPDSLRSGANLLVLEGVGTYVL